MFILKEEFRPRKLNENWSNNFIQWNVRERLNIYGTAFHVIYRFCTVSSQLFTVPAGSAVPVYFPNAVEDSKSRAYASTKRRW